MEEYTRHSVKGASSPAAARSFIVSEFLSDGTTARHAIPFYLHLLQTASQPGFAGWKDRNLVNPSLSLADGPLLFGVGWRFMPPKTDCTYKDVPFDSGRTGLRGVTLSPLFL